MIKINDANLTARETIKVQLEKEISLINEAIEEAKAEGRTSLYYKGVISEPTVQMFLRAGYEVSDWSSNEKAIISWAEKYELFCSNGEIDQIAEELELEIVR